MPSVSPRAQAEKRQTDKSKEQIFKKQFRDKAMNQFMAEMPKIGDKISGFRVIESNVDNGSAVGAFVIGRENHPIIIPALLSNNEMKPFDMMYVKGLNIYLPLNQDFIKELSKIKEKDMGRSVDPPDDLATDKDIRNVVIPPNTGRYAYASKGGLKLPAMLSEAPNHVKEAFLKTLKNDKEYAKRALNTYGKGTLQKALQDVESTVKESSYNDVAFVTIETPKQKIQRVSRNNPEVLRDVQEKGYGYKDNRDETNELVETESYQTLERPTDAGIYRIFLSNGRTKKALIVPGPLDVHSFDERPNADSVSSVAGPSYDWYHKPEYAQDTAHKPHDKEGTNYVGITTDGELFFTRRPFVAERLNISDIDSESFRNLLRDKKANRPSNGQMGIFFNRRGSSTLATTPLKISQVMKDGDLTTIQARHHKNGNMVRLNIREGRNPVRPQIISNEEYRDSENAINFGGRGPGRGQTRSSASVIAMIPSGYSFISASKTIDPDRILKTHDSIRQLHKEELTKMGARQVEVSKDEHEYWVDGQPRTKLSAVKHLAKEHGLTVPDAEHLVKKASDRGHTKAFVLGPKRDKTAQPGSPGRSSTVSHGQARQMREPKQTQRPQAEEQEAGQQQQQQQEEQKRMLAKKMKMMQKKMQKTQKQYKAIQQAAQDVMGVVEDKNKRVMEQLKEKQQNLAAQKKALQSMAQRASQLLQEGGEAGEMKPEDVPTGPMNMNMAKEAPKKLPGKAKDSATQQELFDVASIASITEQNAFDDSISKYMPLFRDSLDKVGRMLINMRTNQSELEEDMGREAYEKMEQRLSNLFENFGEMMITLNEASIEENPRNR